MHSWLLYGVAKLSVAAKVPSDSLEFLTCYPHSAGQTSVAPDDGLPFHIGGASPGYRHDRQS